MASLRGLQEGNFRAAAKFPAGFAKQVFHQNHDDYLVATLKLSMA